jgi:hypothetical protein
MFFGLTRVRFLQAKRKEFADWIRDNGALENR